MDVSTTRRLIKTMLDSRDLMPETREELADYLADLDKGALHPDDAGYIDSLARRLGYLDGSAPAARTGDGDGDDPIFIGDERAADTAAAVQAEIALRAVEQAQALVARLRQGGPEGAAADAATLQEIDAALGEAAKALTPRD